MNNKKHNDDRAALGDYVSFEREHIPPKEKHSFSNPSSVEMGGDGSALVSRRRALKLAGAAALGGAFGLLSSQEKAEARRRRRATRLAASVPGPAAGHGFSGGDVRWAQTLRSTRSGSLTKATIAINKTDETGDYLIQINEVFFSATTGKITPKSRVLASATINDRSVAFGDTTITARFTTPRAAIEQGEFYALVISRPGSNSLRPGVAPVAYTDGELWWNDSLSGENWRTVESFGAGKLDMVCAIYVLV